MRAWIAPIAALLVTTTVAAAQSPIPSLKGAWKGTGKILLFGTTEYLSGSPREAVVRDLEVTHTVLGQDGRLIWGTTSAGNNDVKEPFAWAVTADNKTIIGADTDGYYRITILSPDQMEKCYVQNAASSRQAIVAVLLCHVAGQSIVAAPELPARWPTPRPAAEPAGSSEKLGLNLVSQFRSSHHCAAHSFCELRNQRDTGARLQW